MNILQEQQGCKGQRKYQRNTTNGRPCDEKEEDSEKSAVCQE